MPGKLQPPSFLPATERWLFGVFSTVVVGSILLAIASGEYLLAGLPALLLIIYLGLVDFRSLFLLLMASVPLSTELYLPGGFATDLPTEPLIIGLMLIFMVFLLRHGREWNNGFLRHPITILLLLHIGWIGVTVLTSQDTFVSVKFFLAKIWYVVTLYFLAGYLIREERDVRRLFWFIFIPLIFTILVTLVRHAPSGFSFAVVHRVLHPFYRNHVAYASIMVVFLPFLWYMRQWYPRGSALRRLLTIALGVFLLAIYLSYTRAAYITVLIAAGAYMVIRWRLTRYVLLAAVVVALGLTIVLAVHNRYLDLAPNYERTITHEDFNNLLTATYQGEDLSTMERVYRWIAGFYMTKDKPVFGFGPGTFTFFYKPYTVNSFRTYVSDNPDRSGIHNYYLMVAVEQGYPGLVFFLLLVGFALIRGESVVGRLGKGPSRQMALMALLSLISILSLLIINDLVETDKIGPFFFLNLALLVNLDRQQRCRSNEPSK